MENLYKELRSFFANDMDLNDLFDSKLSSGLTGASMTKMW